MLQRFIKATKVEIQSGHEGKCIMPFLATGTNFRIMEANPLTLEKC